MYKRPQILAFEKRLLEERRFIQVIMGPRQVGKTTMVTQLLKQLKQPHYFVSADGVANTNTLWVDQQWEIARQQWKESGAAQYLLVIDEIQKIDNWSEVAKKNWDADTRNECPMKVILLGSSRLLLQQGLTESLAGRFETLYLGHWSYTEMKDAFGWSPSQFAWYGGYPGAAPLIDDEERWKRYVNDALIETSISKDILMLTRVDKPALMRRLFELGCVYSGQILSYTKILGQLQDAGNTTTLSHYLNLLDTAGLLAGIEKYSPGMARQRSSSPKFLVHNTALVAALHNGTYKTITRQPEEWGRIVESAIGAHLLNKSITEGYSVQYWRNRGDEIDFVLEKRGKTIGIEIKSGTKTKTTGMEAFKKQHQPDKILLVGNTGLSWQEFLEINPNNLF